MSSDVYRGANFQFAYYFKPTEAKHSVLTKEKNFIFPSSEKLASKRDKHNKNNNDNEEDVKPILEIGYRGFNVFRKSLIMVIEPRNNVIEYGRNIDLISAMNIDDYVVTEREELGGEDCGEVSEEK
ncbi:3521_t:CDS:2 [Entrophospora sp. SA101]|nr:2313_t:CDS:2 [Entrophospora sp. SA101]CAJ0874936.1 3521_t:CDS:2 [Entrophospora sp. SA101]